MSEDGRVLNTLHGVRSQPQWVAECSCGWWAAHTIKANAKRRMQLHMNQTHPKDEDK